MAALLAIQLAADALLLLTDVDAVFANWGRASQRPIRQASPAQLRKRRFAAGSMGPALIVVHFFLWDRRLDRMVLDVWQDRVPRGALTVATVSVCREHAS